ncbi:MAG: putative quinol monooxygenase [Flavitalea sp.]
MKKEVIVKWKIRESETAAVLQLLPGLVEATRNEKGNLFYHIFQSETLPNELILHEAYESEEAMALHRATSHYQDIVATRIVPVLEERAIHLVNQIF